MKKLSCEAFDQARAFIKTQARPLDRALFEHRFEGASADLVTAELAHFQNDDGGFGHALEPDLRTPTSSALATEVGLRTLEELGYASDHAMVAGAVRFLLETFDAGYPARCGRASPRTLVARPRRQLGAHVRRFSDHSTGQRRGVAASLCSFGST